MAQKIRLLDLHGELSNLLFAVKEELPYGCEVKIEYTDYVYLQIRVVCCRRHRQIVVDRLSRGVINGPYDYRFSGISHQPTSEEPWQTILATVNLHHDARTVTRPATA